MQLCILDQAHLSHCQKRNVHLERMVFNGQNNISMALHEAKLQCRDKHEMLRMDHTRQMTDMQESCAEQIQATLEKCRVSTNITAITTSMQSFSKLMETKTVELQNCTQQLLASNTVNANFKAEALANSTKMNDRHFRQLRGYRSEINTEKQNHRRCIGHTHQLLANITDYKSDLRLCQTKLKLCNINLVRCDDSFVYHADNMTHLNTSLALHLAVIAQYHRHNIKCEQKLSECLGSKPDPYFTQLKAMYENSRVSNSECLRTKSLYFANVTMCRHSAVKMNEEIKNLTIENRSLRLCNETLNIQTKNWKERFDIAEKKAKHLTQENQYLIMHASDLTTQLRTVDKAIKKSEAETEALSKNIDELNDIITQQKATISQLLLEEKVRAKEFNETRIMCEKSFPALHDLQKLYWSMKQDLVGCLTQKPVEGNSIDQEQSRNITLELYHDEMVKQHTKLVIQCMANTSRAVTDRKVHEYYTLDDLQKMLRSTRKKLPVDPKYFNSQNHLKTCNYYLTECRTERRKLDEKVMRLLEKELGMPDLSAFDYDDDDFWEHGTGEYKKFAGHGPRGPPASLLFDEPVSHSTSKGEYGIIKSRLQPPAFHKFTRTNKP